MKKPMIILIPSLFLFGCTYQAPVLDENQYDQYAMFMATLEKCYYSGRIDTEKAALGKRHFYTAINKFSYDKYTLDRKYNEFKNSYESGNVPQSVEIANCKDIELGIVQREQEINLNRQKLEEQRKVINDTYNAMPKTTYCNQIGTQTFCNSY